MRHTLEKLFPPFILFFNSGNFQIQKKKKQLCVSPVFLQRPFAVTPNDKLFNLLLICLLLFRLGLCLMLCLGLLHVINL